jgi:hypothetical protein
MRRTSARRYAKRNDAEIDILLVPSAFRTPPRNGCSTTSDSVGECRHSNRDAAHIFPTSRFSWSGTHSGSQPVTVSDTHLSSTTFNRGPARSVFLQVLHQTCCIDWSEQPFGPSRDRDIRERAEKITTRVASRLCPWSVTLFTEVGSSPVLMLSMHHALYDGDVLRYLVDDIEAAYCGSGGLIRRVQLSEALAFCLDGERSVTEKFWVEALRHVADPNSTPWPDLVSSPVPGASRHMSKRVKTSLDHKALSTASQGLGASIGQLVQTAWGIVLGAYLGTDKVVFGENLSFRMGNVGLASAIAPLITTTPVPVKMSADTTARDLVTELARLSTSSVRHRFVSMRCIRRAIRRPLEQPLFSSLFVVNPMEGPDQNVGKVWRRLDMVAGLDVEHPLAVNVYVGAKDVTLDVSASTDIMYVSNLDGVRRIPLSCIQVCRATFASGQSIGCLHLSTFDTSGRASILAQALCRCTLYGDRASNTLQLF